MIDYALLGLAVFAGALVSGVAGFAFSAAAGAILLHVLSPQEGVPLMMACSIAVQSASLLWLRQVMRWRESIGYLLGGAVGMVPALYVLARVDAVQFRFFFGVFLSLYSIFMLLRPQSQLLQNVKTKVFDGVVGFAGGLIGGLTAMPGAAPVVWCDLRGFPKEQQRGLVQPYIASMQVVAMVLLIGSGHLSASVLVDFGVTLPALLAGTALGLHLFGKVNQLNFRRFVLVALFVSGLSYAIR